MYDAFATRLESFQSCEYPDCSFFDLIDSIWQGPKEASSPLHRLCTLMRKMKAKSFLQEKLILNQELSEEKQMAEKYFDGEVELEATRLTFFLQATRFFEMGSSRGNY